MSSLFTTIPGNTVKGFGGKSRPIPFYLQFVPGYVIEVVTSSKSPHYQGEETINTIIAFPHISEKTINQPGNVDLDENRYYPLLRGMADVPTKGDPVMLFTIGRVNYYLGPLNDISNNPTFNVDSIRFGKQIDYPIDGTQKAQTVRPTADQAGGSETPAFNINERYKRLQKFRNMELDYGDNDLRDLTVGDTIFEGRYGNSIRIGSRDVNPHIFISNGRDQDQVLETLVDGSLISLTQNGTLNQHFGSFGVTMDDETTSFQTNFKLASDIVTSLENPQNRFMEDLIISVNGGAQANTDSETESVIYDYNSNQILFTSDRLTMNSKIDDMFLSSNKDIHIGTKRHLTISTNEDLIIESENTYLGNPNVEGRQMEQMVLGNKLLELFKETLEAIKNSQGICQGAPIPLADDTGAPGSLKMKITQIEQKVDNIISSKHFIEPNE